jgi:pimeloyl-ACP methyl ester carboxylesterase
MGGYPEYFPDQMDEFNNIVQAHPMADIHTLSWVRSSHKYSREAEFELLNRILDVNYPAIPAETRKSDHNSKDKIKVSIGWVKVGPDRCINTLCNYAERNARVLLINHGYGGGLGVFFKNYGDLLSLKGWKVYSIDWMGMGNSSRPAWVQKDSNLLEMEYTKQAEDFFIDSLEEWRIQNGISSKMTIIGHSLGAYLSTCKLL